MTAMSSQVTGCRSRTYAPGESLADQKGSGHHPEHLIYKIADSQSERAAALRLVHEVYTAERLMPPNPSGMRVTPWHLLEGTHIYVAKWVQRVVCTMTSIPDGARGLPLETIYPKEVASRRRAGRRLAEVTCLAARQDAFSTEQGFQVFVRLVGLMFQSCRFIGIERLLIAVHPRHARFYRRALGFEQIGGIRSYPSVCGQPAVACEHDLSRHADPRFPLLRDVYRVGFPPQHLAGRPLNAVERDSLGRVVDHQLERDFAFAD